MWFTWYINIINIKIADKKMMQVERRWMLLSFKLANFLVFSAFNCLPYDSLTLLFLVSGHFLFFWGLTLNTLFAHLIKWKVLSLPSVLHYIYYSWSGYCCLIQYSVSLFSFNHGFLFLFLPFPIISIEGKVSVF